MADIFAIPVGNEMDFLNTKYSFYISYFNIFLYVYVVLRAYEKMLKKTAEQRQQLLRALGHDVKNPIAIIVMTTQLIQTKFGQEPADKTLEKLRSSNNDLEKADYLNTFEKKLLEQHLAIFLYNPTYTYPVAKKLKGVDELKFINLPADRLASISTWFIKTKRSLAN